MGISTRWICSSCKRFNLRSAGFVELCCYALGAYLLVLLWSGTMRHASAQAPDTQGSLNLGIIVTTNRSEIDEILKALRAGMDFSVLAKERSIDATAVDGGFLGKLPPEQLRTELRDAIKGRNVGELSEVVQMPNGFAILKILPTAPPLTDIDPKRISSLIGTGAIRYGAPLSGQVEANAIMRQFPKPEGWNRDLQQVCSLRKESLTQARSGLRAALDASKTANMDHDTVVDQINGHAALAQLFAYDGEMDSSIAEWKIAYAMAKERVQVFLPNLEESLGTAYLHRSEMRNGIYRNSTTLDIFPPLNQGTSYSEKEDSAQAIAFYKEYLKDNPEDLEVRWLLNLSYMTLGQYPDGVPAAYRISRECVSIQPKRWPF